MLESKSRRTRSPFGVVTSVTAHLGIILVAIHATAQTRPRPAAVEKLVIVPLVPKSPSAAPSPSQPTQRKTRGPWLKPNVTIPIYPKLPPIDLVPPSTSLSDFSTGIQSSGNADPEATPIVGKSTFTADEVERQVSLLPGAPVPSYPEVLRAAGVEGKVIAEFIVDEGGEVETDSVRFIKSDNALFEASVRSTLRRMRFAPAEIGGKKVRQLVQMPFIFTISSH